MSPVCTGQMITLLAEAGHIIMSTIISTALAGQRSQYYASAAAITGCLYPIRVDDSDVLKRCRKVYFYVGVNYDIKVVFARTSAIICIVIVYMGRAICNSYDTKRYGGVSRDYGSSAHIL